MESLRLTIRLLSEPEEEHVGPDRQRKDGSGGPSGGKQDQQPQSQPGRHAREQREQRSSSAPAINMDIWFGSSQGIQAWRDWPVCMWPAHSLTHRRKPGIYTGTVLWGHERSPDKERQGHLGC
jgi:hypothetical protein